MMDRISSFILSIVCASVICSIADILTKDKKQANITVKLLSGIFLAITLLSPIQGFSIDRIFNSWEDLEQDAQAMSQDGQMQANDALISIIKQRMEAYVLEKAEQLGVTLQSEITISETLEPERIILTADVTPYERKQMEKILTEELGISGEEQIWK